MHGAEISRRSCLYAAIALAACSALGPAHAAARRARLAAAWDDAQGQHHVGVLELGLATPAGPAKLRVRHALQVPTRAHAVVPWPDGSIVAVARRPGSWLLRWRPGSAASTARWCWSEADRSFNGHVLRHGPGALVSTETQAADGEGLLVCRDATTLAILDEWPTGGIDPHAVLALPEGGWLVANGGVPTRPESGRVKTDRSTMDSSIVQLDPRGRAGGIWRLADRRLSLRHLARHADGMVGIALQAEHDDADERRRAPLLALWDGRELRPGEAALLEGYAGDIVALDDGFLLGATRAGCVVRADLQGRLLGQHPLTQACALTVVGPQAWLAAGSADFGVGTRAGLTESSRSGGLRLDNHWMALVG